MSLTCFYEQPGPFEKFIYNNSLAREKSPFQSEFIFCYDQLLPKVSLVVDLYSQLDPPLLSPHVLKKNFSRSDAFVTDIMHQMCPKTSYYKYFLNNCHIRRTSHWRRLKVIKKKLLALKVWQQAEKSLACTDKEMVESTIVMDYTSSKRNNEDKVYLGITPYVFNDVTNCREKIAETTFSHAIYDCSHFLLASPCLSTISGGTKHILKVDNSYEIKEPGVVRLLLSDEEKTWQHVITGDFKEYGIYFTAPPYTGHWNLEDGNRLVFVQILDCIEDLPKIVFKFVYN